MDKKNKFITVGFAIGIIAFVIFFGIVTRQYCPECHGRVQYTYQEYCTECGFELENKNLCPECKEFLSKNDDFCGHCGYEVEGMWQR